MSTTQTNDWWWCTEHHRPRTECHCEYGQKSDSARAGIKPLIWGFALIQLPLFYTEPHAEGILVLADIVLLIRYMIRRKHRRRQAIRNMQYAQQREGLPTESEILRDIYSRNQVWIPHQEQRPLGETRKRAPVPAHVRRVVWERDGGRCTHCLLTDNESMQKYGTHLQYDHIIPFSQNGADTVTNLQLLCQGCNAAKGNRYVG